LAVQVGPEMHQFGIVANPQRRRLGQRRSIFADYADNDIPGCGNG
jgi:hypothetical protein